jgi:hypothetical protein
MVTGTTGVCTIACANETVCLPTWACLNISGTSVCVPNDSGRACPTGQGRGCFAGLCLQHPTMLSSSVCATPCLSSRACPANFSCSLTQVGASQESVCTPDNTPCTSSNNCVSRFCGTSKQNPSDGICEGTCSSATDCPAGWGCGLDDDGMGGVVSVCQPVGTSCNANGGVNNCYSQTCALSTPDAGYCTVLCMTGTGVEEPARCPAGYTCVDESAGGPPLFACETP